jgi:hypothetical protein
MFLGRICDGILLFFKLLFQDYFNMGAWTDLPKVIKQGNEKKYSY